jgi:hypothetical protein
MAHDDMLDAIISASLRNGRENPAVAAATEHAPHQWTPEEETELAQRLHGTESERIAKLVDEQNARNRLS